MEPERLPRMGAYCGYNFPFSLIDKVLVGSPEEEANTEYHDINVSVSYVLMTCWKIKGDDLLKVMFEYGKRKIIQHVKNGTLEECDDLFLTSDNTENRLEFDVKRIKNPVDVSIEIDIPKTKLMSDISEFELAELIIDSRDKINSLFKLKYKGELLIIPQERNLLELFRPVNTQEEFSFSLSGLATMVTGFNIILLRTLTGIDDKRIKSISLFEKFLKEYYEKDSIQSIKIFRSINTMRQGYPVHIDHAGCIKAHKSLNLIYPIDKYNDAWKVILSNYYKGLKEIRDLLIEENEQINDA